MSDATVGGTVVRPQIGDPALDGDHERCTHIVLEAARFGDDAEATRVADVTAAYIEGTPAPPSTRVKTRVTRGSISVVICARA